MVEELIPRIYDTALEPEGWPELLRDLGEAMNACDFLSQEALDGFGAGENWSHDFDRSRYDEAPADIWRPEGSRSIRYLAAAPLAQPFDRRVCMPDADIGLDPIGRHFVGDRLFHIVLSTLQRGDGALSFLMIGRSKGSQPFHADEVDRIAKLTDHLGRAMRIHRVLAETRLRSAGFAAAIGQLASGMILADGKLRIVHANHAAERMLEQGDGLGRRSGFFRLGSVRAQRKLERAAARLSGRSPDYGEARIMAQRPSQALPYTIDVMPALGDATSTFAPLAQLLVVITDPEAGLSQIAPAQLARDLGLTMAEARIAAAAGQALPLKQVAARTGVSGNTVKSHLRSVYGKLGVQSQAQLVRLLMARLPPRGPDRVPERGQPQGRGPARTG